MKTRQFKQLAGLSPARRASLVVEGLVAIGDNVVTLVEELEKCNAAGAYRSARLLRNVGREEAGKFLVLIDAWRAPDTDARTISRQFARAGAHLSKLIYAQIADYSIASQSELVSAVNRHRQGLYLDGPNGHDWIFRNDLLSERENALYIDLVDSEGQLEWWPPHDHEMSEPVPRSMQLVMALLSTGLVSVDGLAALREAWVGFDPHEDSHCQEWIGRTQRALQAFPDNNVEGDRWTSAAYFVADRWPMPMVELELEEAKTTIDAMVAERETAYEAYVMSEYGYP